MKQCQICGKINADEANFCNSCGHQFGSPAGQQEPPRYSQDTDYGYQYQNQGYQDPNAGYSYAQQQGGYQFDNNYYYLKNDAFQSDMYGKSRGITALLSIFLGSLGVHYFYLGKIGGGLICILLTLVTCGLWSMITLTQGIMLFCCDNAYFDRRFVFNPATFPVF